MYPVIRSHDEQALDNMSEEKKRSLTYRCGPFQIKALLSRPQKNGESRPPSRGQQGVQGSPDEGYN